MHTPWFPAVLTLASTSIAAGQYIPFQVLAEQSTAYPTIPPPGTLGFLSLGGTVIAPDGEATFTASYNAPIGQALFLADETGPRHIAWGGTPITGTDWVIAGIQPHPLYPLGNSRVVFRANVHDTITSATSDALLYADADGLHAIASFQPAPGLTNLLLQGGGNIAASGSAIILSNLTQGIWAGPLNAPQQLAAPGAPAHGMPSPYVYYIFGTPSINASGDVGFGATYWITGDNASQGIGIYRTVGGQLELLSRSGDPVPGLSGNVFHHPTGNVRINGAGQLVFSATVRNPQTSATTKTLWFADGQELTLIAAAGQNAPGTPAQFADVAPSNPVTTVISDAGLVVFNATLTGPGVTPSNSYGLWVWSAELGLRLLARNGDQIPGLPAGTTYGLLGRTAANASGQIVFDWSAGYSVADARGLAAPILRAGVPLPPNPWNWYQFSLFTAPGAWGPGASGYPTFLNDAGQIALHARANFVGGSTTAIIRAQLPAPCYTNCDLSLTPPTLNVADFTCFLQHFAAGDAWANCDGSTNAPTLNVADFTCFLQQFAAGCP